VGIEFVGLRLSERNRKAFDFLRLGNGNRNRNYGSLQPEAKQLFQSPLFDFTTVNFGGIGCCSRYLSGSNSNPSPCPNVGFHAVSPNLQQQD
jgi:hypothetical protein